MKWKKHNILNTLEQLQRFDAYFEEANPQLIAVDTETTGLSFNKNVVVGVSISLDSKQGFYVPLLDWIVDETSRKNTKTEQIFEKGFLRCPWTGGVFTETVRPKEYQVPEEVKRFLEKWLLHSEAQIIMHNAPFDVLMIESTIAIDITDKIWCDTALLKHTVDENTKHGLKETAVLWAEALGFDTAADKEQQEMGASVIRNGGVFNKNNKMIWRTSPDIMGKYACQDTILTFGLYEVGISKLINEYGEKQVKWFFEDEVMPLCREVMIPMKRKGAFIDVPYFEEMRIEVETKLEQLESSMYLDLVPFLEDFTLGISLDAAVTQKRLLIALAEREGLTLPLAKTGKPTFAKDAVKKEFERTKHWVWGWANNINDLIIDKNELNALKHQIYLEVTGRKYPFNFKSNDHLRWLLFQKLKLNPKDFPETDGGDISVKAEVLKTVVGDKLPVIKKLLLHKKLSKQLSSYILPALELNEDGWLRMDFKQNGTTSGRFACSGGFNLQTLPKVEELDRCRKCDAKNPQITQTIKILANMDCDKCGYHEEDIFTPSAIKAGFIAPPGFKIINADFSSLEPKCFAEMSGDSKLKAVYLDNLDLYSKIYCDMEDTEGKYSPNPKDANFLKKVRNDLRSMVKPVVLGIPYGARAWQTAKLMNFTTTILRGDDEVEVVDAKQGAAFREKYLDTYPDLRKYMMKQELDAQTYGYVETILGRRRHFKWAKKVGALLLKSKLSYEDFLDTPKKQLRTNHFNDIMNAQMLHKLLLDNNVGLRDKKGVPRQWDFICTVFGEELNNAKNFPIQGLAAHIANRSMLELARYLKDRKLKGSIILQVHDEVTTLASEQDAEEVAKYQQLAMENNECTKLISIPMGAEPIICNNLKDSK